MTMTILVPRCQTVRIAAFRGDRSRSFGASFQSKLDDEKTGRGPGPTTQDCLLDVGHAGVSIDGGTTLFGFNPDGSGLPVWQLLNRLKNGDRFHGVVRDDTAIFTAANMQRLNVLRLEIVLPDPHFRGFQNKLDGERWKSKYYYGFPNGDGDCNCITWLERLGLPLVTGRMNEFIGLVSGS